MKWRNEMTGYTAGVTEMTDGYIVSVRNLARPRDKITTVLKWTLNKQV
jgi:hypothetical protein